MRIDDEVVAVAAASPILEQDVTTGLRNLQNSPNYVPGTMVPTKPGQGLPKVTTLVREFCMMSC